MRAPALAASLALSLTLAACGPVQRTLRGYADAPAQELDDALALIETSDAPAWMIGQRRLVLDDFGSLDTDGLNSYGIPWKLVAAVFVQRRAERDGSPVSDATLRRVLGEFGFLFPERILNWAGPPLPRFRRPIGMLSGTAARGFPAVELEVAGFGCASCHSGTTYDEGGMPTGDVWLGMPNTSLDVTAYGDSLFVALRAALEDPDRLMGTVRSLFPDASVRELRTLDLYAIPRGRKRLAELDALYGRALPFENGGPGITNGVGSTRHRMGEALDGHAGHAWVALPYMGDRHLRSSLLADGVYGFPGSARFESRTPADATPAHLNQVAGVLGFFTIPTQGVSAEKARRAIPAMEDVARFIARIAPPRFPGAVDSAWATLGEGIYRDRCAACHGETTPGLTDVRLASFPNVLVPQEEMGTDPARWLSADDATLERIPEIGFGPWVDALNTGGYVATPLTAVWATAPYLHNGSVPTLWHLMNPELRPERFQLGGHKLDYEQMGIAGAKGHDGVYRYPAGYRPWSQPAIYDTRLPGRSNRGHEAEFEGLSDAQKRALIEYLKVL